MMLPEGHEDMTDDELEAALIESGAYDQDGAAAVVELVRHGDLDTIE